EPGALWVKRDDCTGLAGGGNKARKLEFLCAEALAQGCDTLVTGGGRHSNHARMTAAAANRLGLGCTLVLASSEPSHPTGRVVLDHGHFGDGYGEPTDSCRDAMDLAARLEGLILDPVYTGKALAALVTARKEGRIEADTRVVFLHTGGMPALFASRYAGWIA